MSDDYFFMSTKITDAQVRLIIKTADFDPGHYTYAQLVDKDGWIAVDANEENPMAVSLLKKAAKDSHIKVEISAT